MEDIRFVFAELLFVIQSDLNINIENAFASFMRFQKKDEEAAGKYGKVKVIFKWKWEDEIKVQKEDFLGGDLLQDYYHKKSKLYCLTKGGYKGYIACARLNEIDEIECMVNLDLFPSFLPCLGGIIRFLPMRYIFLNHGILFFHSSQICFQDLGIVFVGPSGIGKTTQAKLWERYKGAKIVCNDRTLVRKIDGGWKAYGYPIDGSSPIGVNQSCRLCCMIILKQNAENEIQKLKSSEAITSLISNLIIDSWNEMELNKSFQLLAELVSEIPAYELKCTCDENATGFLENKLVEDGVFNS